MTQTRDVFGRPECAPSHNFERNTIMAIEHQVQYLSEVGIPILDAAAKIEKITEEITRLQSQRADDRAALRKSLHGLWSPSERLEAAKTAQAAISVPSK